MRLKAKKQNRKKSIWAFSNENIACLGEKIDISGEKMIGIGGAGDQALSFLAWGAESYLAADKRKNAVSFLRLKKAMVACLAYQDFIAAFSGKAKAREVFSKVKINLSQEEEKFWGGYFDNDRNFLQTLKRSGFFYRYSFRNFKRRKFFPYLTPSGYKQAQESVSALETVAESMEDLLTRGRQRFDIIYFSNILDSPFQGGIYLKEVSPVLNLASLRLENEGKIIAATLVKKKLVKALTDHGFEVVTDISPKLPPFLYYIASSRYPYSFLIAKGES